MRADLDRRRPDLPPPRIAAHEPRGGRRSPGGVGLHAGIDELARRLKEKLLSAPRRRGLIERGSLVSLDKQPGNVLTVSGGR